jgi:hypothetical protein
MLEPVRHQLRAGSHVPCRRRLCWLVAAIVLSAGACSDSGGNGAGVDGGPAEPDVRTQLMGFFAADGRLSSDEAECAVTYLIGELDEADLEELVMVDSFEEASDEQIAVLRDALSGCLGGPAAEE